MVSHGPEPIQGCDALSAERLPRIERQAQTSDGAAIRTRPPSAISLPFSRAKEEGLSEQGVDSQPLESAHVLMDKPCISLRSWGISVDLHNGLDPGSYSKGKPCSAGG